MCTAGLVIQRRRSLHPVFDATVDVGPTVPPLRRHSLYPSAPPGVTLEKLSEVVNFKEARSFDLI